MRYNLGDLIHHHDDFVEVSRKVEVLDHYRMAAVVSSMKSVVRFRASSFSPCLFRPRTLHVKRASTSPSVGLAGTSGVWRTKWRIAQFAGPSVGLRWSSSSSFQHIDVSEHETANGRGSYAIVKLTNPKKLNIVNSPTLAELKAAFESLQYNEHLRVVIFTGETTHQYTPAFCGGADIREMSQISTSQQARAFITQVYDVCEAVRNIPAVVISKIDGLCLGAGLEIAAACDFRVATKRSLFAMPEVEIGIPSVVHARSLVNIMGWQEAKRLMLYATKLDGEAARRTGLVDDLADTPEELDKIVQRDIETLSSYGRKGMHAQKKLFKAWEEGDFHDGLRTSIDAFADSYADGGVEPRAFMNAWIEKQRQRKR